MGAHEALADRPEGDDLLFCQVGEADRLARILQRVLADEILDFGRGWEPSLTSRNTSGEGLP
jgi:hypothetical protein